jgi:hypothetical protein
MRTQLTPGPMQLKFLDSNICTMSLEIQNFDCFLHRQVIFWVTAICITLRPMQLKLAHKGAVDAKMHRLTRKRRREKRTGPPDLHISFLWDHQWVPLDVNCLYLVTDMLCSNSTGPGYSISPKWFLDHDSKTSQHSIYLKPKV